MSPAAVRPRRRAASLVEFAVICPVLFLLILGALIGGLGIFRYQEVAWLAREGARYASVHGTQYAKEVPNATAATPQDVYNNAILPNVIILDASKLSYSVTWNQSNDPYTVSADYELGVNNTVTVTVTYQWFPEVFLGGPINLSSSSTMPMSY
jgi:Flp pilus assembly protein TadG